MQVSLAVDSGACQAVFSGEDRHVFEARRAACAEVGAMTAGDGGPLTDAHHPLLGVVLQGGPGRATEAGRGPPARPGWPDALREWCSSRS